MIESEFDKFAEEYQKIHQSVIGASGEKTSFFIEYKIKDLVHAVSKQFYPDNLSILDFGAGIGQSIPYILKYLPHSQITCLDVSKKSLRIGADKYPEQAKFVHFDGAKIQFPDDIFHVVYAACVFHHIPKSNHQKLIREILRVLVPGGIFVIFEHNPYNFLTVRAVNNCSFDENAVLIKGKPLSNLIKKSGFNAVDLNYRIFFPNFLKFFRPFERFMTWVPFGAQYYIQAFKSK